MRILLIMLCFSLVFGDVKMKKANISYEKISGFGSAISPDFFGGFYLLSDGKSPAILHLKKQNDTFIIDKKIKLKSTLDPEGLVALNDGTFWICDEKKMRFLKINSHGKIIKSIDNLSHELKNIAKNKGFEGLSKDKSKLTAIVQSSLKNPNKKAQKSDLTRIISFDLKSNKIAQYLYRQEKPKHSNSDMVSLGHNEFLVLERDNKNKFAKIFKISLKNATDINSISLLKNMTKHDKYGLLIEGKTLEEFVMKNGWKALKKYNIKAVKKTQMLDLKRINYPHKKPEGICLMDENSIAIINDDEDFTQIYFLKGVL